MNKPLPGEVSPRSKPGRRKEGKTDVAAKSLHVDEDVLEALRELSESMLGELGFRMSNSQVMRYLVHKHKQSKEKGHE